MPIFSPADTARGAHLLQGHHQGMQAAHRAHHLQHPHHTHHHLPGAAGAGGVGGLPHPAGAHGAHGGPQMVMNGTPSQGGVLVRAARVRLSVRSFFHARVVFVGQWMNGRG